MRVSFPFKAVPFKAIESHCIGDQGRPRIAQRCLVGILLGIWMLHAPNADANSDSGGHEGTPIGYQLKDYQKAEYRIPMRDGAKLFTTLFIPKTSASEKLPFMMTRTLYNGWFEHVPPDDLAKAGYIFVFQDARGTYRSDGQFLELSPRRDRRSGTSLVDESTDTYDTVEWLLTHIPNNNGKVGIRGGSYEGFYTAASIADTHPAIKAAEISMMGDWNYRHGALMLGDNFEFYADYRPRNPPGSSPFNYWTRDAYQFFLDAGPLGKLTETYFKENPNPFWTDAVAHDTLDEFWESRDMLSHMTQIRCAVLNVSGWFDQYSAGGAIAFFHAIQTNNPMVHNQLVMGPWNHGPPWEGAGRRVGNVDFQSDTAEDFRRKMRDPFFEHYLKGKPLNAPKVSAFETGTNVWREYSQWPPATAKAQTLYLRESGKVSFTPPSLNAAFDEYVSDPAKPVPLTGHVPPSDEMPLMSPEYMTADQRFAGRRPDVLVYQTEPLKEDMTVVGPVSPKLFVSTTGTDSDWVVKLIDVYPTDFPEVKRAPASEQGFEDVFDVRPPRDGLAGYQQLVRGEPLRGKFRHGWNRPEPFVPGQPESIQFSMADVNHTFRKGHRIMVQVQSSWFPLADLNPQTFMRIPDAKAEDFRKATQRVYREKEMASGIGLQVMPSTSSR